MFLKKNYKNYKKKSLENVNNIAKTNQQVTNIYWNVKCYISMAQFL